MGLSRRKFFGLGAAVAAAPIAAKLPAPPTVVTPPVAMPVGSVEVVARSGGAFTAAQLAEAGKRAIDFYLKNPEFDIYEEKA